MEDAQRFLRYVIPGLVLMIEVSFYLLLSSHTQFLGLVKKAGENIGLSILALIASGGIGFCLANIYHFIYWRWPFRLLVPNHHQLIKDSVKRGWLRLENRTNGKEFTEGTIKNLNQKEAWLISNLLWYQRLGSSPRIKNAERAVDRLVDIMHSLGTTLVGSAIAIPIWFFAHYEFSNNLPSLWEYLKTGPAISIILWIHLWHYRRMVVDFQFTSDSLMSCELMEQFDKNKTPIIINIPQSDLKERGI